MQNEYITENQYFVNMGGYKVRKSIFDTNQHLFMIKALGKLGIEGNFLNLMKDIYRQPPANIIFNGETVFSL